MTFGIGNELARQNVVANLAVRSVGAPVETKGVARVWKGFVEFVRNCMMLPKAHSAYIPPRTPRHV